MKLVYTIILSIITMSKSLIAAEECFPRSELGFSCLSDYDGGRFEFGVSKSKHIEPLEWESIDYLWNPKNSENSVLWFRFMPRLGETHIYIDSIDQAFEVWQNGNLVAHYGTIDGTKSVDFPGYKDHLIEIPEHDHFLVFKIVSSVKNRGMVHPVVIGSYRDITAMLVSKDIFKTIVCFVSLLLTIFSIFLVLNSKNKSIMTYLMMASFFGASYVFFRHGIVSLLFSVYSDLESSIYQTGKRTSWFLFTASCLSFYFSIISLNKTAKIIVIYAFLQTFTSLLEPKLGLKIMQILAFFSTPIAMMAFWINRKKITLLQNVLFFSTTIIMILSSWHELGQVTGIFERRNGNSIISAMLCYIILFVWVLYDRDNRRNYLLHEKNNELIEKNDKIKQLNQRISDESHLRFSIIGDFAHRLNNPLHATKISMHRLSDVTKKVFRIFYLLLEGEESAEAIEVKKTITDQENEIDILMQSLKNGTDLISTAVIDVRNISGIDGCQLKEVDLERCLFEALGRAFHEGNVVDVSTNLSISKVISNHSILVMSLDWLIKKVQGNQTASSQINFRSRMLNGQAQLTIEFNDIRNCFHQMNHLSLMLEPISVVPTSTLKEKLLAISYIFPNEVTIADSKPFQTAA